MRRASTAERRRQARLAALRIALAAAVTLGCPAARAVPGDYLPVGDPLAAELRLLDVTDPGADGRIRLPHLGTLPLQWRELQGPGAPAESLGPARAISLARLERALARHALPSFAPHPVYRSTPWLWRGESEQQIVELSAGIEGRVEGDRFAGRTVSGAGGRLRVSLAFERWLVHGDALIGRVDGARHFADPLVANSDVLVHTEDAFLAYRGDRWDARFGRSRWHWGPGEEASLLLSKTSPAFTALAARVRIEPLRADLITIAGTLDRAAGEQLAAHRLEWQPHARLRVGLAEGARYHAAGWSPLYAVGLIPYTMVQRLEAQDDPDSAAAVRNNVLVSADVAWRPISGTRVYAELLVDDLHARTTKNPNKLGWQLGWEGVGEVARTRVSWGGEYTRLSRFVYSSSFGRAWATQGQSLGFPTGPDAGRLRLRGAWDPDPDWQLAAHVTRTEQGEGDLQHPFTGGPPPDPFRFTGVVERTREAELGLRWWPASGVDVAVWGGYRWVENDAHRTGVSLHTPTAALELNISR